MRQHRLQSIRCKLHVKSHPAGLKLLALIILISSPLVWGTDYDVMLDASGSMQGFKKEQQTWQKLLNNLETSARRKYQFGDRNNFKRVDAPLINVRLRDQKTFLGKALKDWLALSSEGDVLVIVTDNVADNSANASQSQQLFYDLLSKPESPFSHIAIFPMTLPFNGKVYPIGAGRGKSYQGERALSIYAIARNVSDQAFDEQRSQIETKITGFKYQYIQIKPFDGKTISGLVGDINIAPDSAQDADVKFENHDGTQRLVVHSLRLGKEINFSFKVNIQSSSSFELQDVELLADIQLFTDDEMRQSFEMTENFIAEVSPRRATISPSGFQDIRVDFQNAPFNFGELDFLDKLAFAMRNTMTIQGNLDLQFKANRENMNLSQGILHTWSYEGNVNNLNKPRANVQEKVYKLGDLVKRMLPESNDIQKLHSVPVILELRYPLWPLLVVFLGIVLMIGILWTIIQKTSKQYVLEDEMGHQTDIAIALGQPHRHYSGNGQLMFSLSSWGIIFWISTPLRLTGSHFVSGGQNIRISDPDMGDEYSWQLREVTANKSTSMEDDDDWL